MRRTRGALPLGAAGLMLFASGCGDVFGPLGESVKLDVELTNGSAETRP